MEAPEQCPDAERVDTVPDAGAGGTDAVLKSRKQVDY